VKPAESAALKAALEAAQIEMVPLSALVKSPLNVRTIPYPPESVGKWLTPFSRSASFRIWWFIRCRTACRASRRAVVAWLPCSFYTRAAHRCRHLVIVKRVSDELAVVGSMVENNNRVAMHPAEQISGFRTLSEQGKTPAQIGDQLGYSSRHVQRMLKLASLAPELIALLAENSLTWSSVRRQSGKRPGASGGIYQRVKAQHSCSAHMLKRAITDTEISVRDARFMFVGREAYEAAGGGARGPVQRSGGRRNGRRGAGRASGAGEAGVRRAGC
jgi:ParB family chromosome partitioning protein